MTVIISLTCCSVLYVYYSHVRDKSSQMRLFGLSCSCNDFINNPGRNLMVTLQKRVTYIHASAT